MSWMSQEKNAGWNRRRERNFEWQRAKRDLRALVLFVVISFVLGMFIKNVSPVAVLGEFITELLIACGIGQ